MKTGTKSLLFGVHQFILHPITVWIAWIWLYRTLPTWRETVCVVIHDWGYWGKAKMDDEEGEKHPEWAAGVAHWLLDRPRFVPLSPSFFIWKRHNTTYHDLCLYHSRHYARNAGVEPSRLCWADKMSILVERWWTYLPRAWASGELEEYREIAEATGFIPKVKSSREWFAWIRDRLGTLGREKRGDVVPYVNPARKAVR